MGASLELTRYRFSVADYHKMGEAGIFSEDDRVELIEGEIIAMPPIGSHHAAPVIVLTRIFVRACGDRAWVSVQNSVILSDDSEPQPDLLLLRPRADAYRDSTPEVADVLLLVEVSDSTLAYDRGRKLALYARRGICEVWIVDVQGGTIEVCRDPASDDYLERRVLGRGEVAEAAALAGVRVAVDDVVG